MHAFLRIGPRRSKGRLRADRRKRLGSTALAITVLSGTVMILVGNVLGSDRAGRLHAYSVGVGPITAVCFLLLTTGLLFWWHQSRTACRLAFWLGMSVALIAAASIGMRITFGPRSFGPLGLPVSYATGSEFLLSAYCLCAFAQRRFWNPRVFSFSATAGLLFALVAVVSYLFGSRDSSGIIPLDGMAPQTALNFLLLDLALLLARPDASWLGLLFSAGAGSAMARRLLPMAIVGPLLLCLLVYTMANVELFSAGFRLGLLAIALMILAGIAVLWNARTENRSEFLAFHDPLTELANRSLFAARLTEALARAAESGGKVGLVLCDIDRFKTINDRMGHIFGDSLLRLTAERLRKAIRFSDTPARVGGDEFAVILPDRVNERVIRADSRKICEAVAQPAEIYDQFLQLTASFGVAIYPTDAFETETLMRHADLALREAKADPATHLCYFDESLATAAQQRARIETELGDAIKRDEMLLHYQPQFDITTQSVRSVEALVRWRRSDREIVPPSEFISIAEASGLIRPLGRWVLQEACRQQARWRALGLNVVMAVNVSPIEAADEGFPRFVDAALDAAGVDARSIEFEITEGLLLEHDSDSTQRFLKACQQRAIGLAIDDFGTGYSSLSYLTRLPISKIKIDRSFVGALGQRRDDTLVKALIDVGHQLGNRVVAEGIETRGQLEFLQTFGCDDVQGYLLCPPADAAAIEHLLR